MLVKVLRNDCIECVDICTCVYRSKSLYKKGDVVTVIRVHPSTMTFVTVNEYGLLNGWSFENFEPLNNLDKEILDLYKIGLNNTRSKFDV